MCLLLNVSIHSVIGFGDNTRLYANVSRYVCYILMNFRRDIGGTMAVVIFSMGHGYRL